jgi:formamidopyrimidine-DNA glycosylase
MNQEVFCGCGQVEKMEALFKYGIHPDEPINNITDKEWGNIIFFFGRFCQILDPVPRTQVRSEAAD